MEPDLECAHVVMRPCGDVLVMVFDQSGVIIERHLLREPFGNGCLLGSGERMTCQPERRPTGTLVVVGGGLSSKLRVKLLIRFETQRLAGFIANVNKADIIALKELIEAGKVAPVIDRTYQLSEAPEAIRDVETGHAHGKVIITV